MVSPSTLPLRIRSTPSLVPSPNVLRFLKAQSKRVNCRTESPCFAGSGSQSQAPTSRRPVVHHRYHHTRSRERDAHATECDSSAIEALCRPTGQTYHAPSFIDTASRPSPSQWQLQLRLRLRQQRPSSSLRQFSSSSQQRLPTIRQLLGLNPKTGPAHLCPSDLPPRTSNLEDGGLFNFPRIAAKAINEPRLRCTELDENGNVTLVNGEFKKTELIAKYGLLPRDLRKIDSSVLPNILVRHSAILISLLHLHVLIKADRVLVFDVYGSADSYTQSVFMYDLEGKLRHKDRTGSQNALPYEFRALEAVLVSVTAGLEAEFEGVREPVVQVLRALEEDIDRGKLRQLLVYSKRLSTFEQKARLVRDAINTLLDADDDLTAMYLTERKNGKEREEDDHQEVEMLLESYHKICDEIVQASGNLVTNIRNTEEIVKAILDANRNSLMLLDLKFSIGTLGLAFGTLCSSFYGMNLKNFIEESDFGFAGVTGLCFGASAFVCYFALCKLRKVQRVRMWGEGGIDKHYGLMSPPPPHHHVHAHPHAAAVAAAARQGGGWRVDAADSSSSYLKRHGDARQERLKRRHVVGWEPTATSASAHAHASVKQKGHQHGGGKGESAV